MTRAWNYAPGSQGKPYDFCVEIEPDKCLMRHGKPWVMTFEQGKSLIETLQHGKTRHPKDIFLHLDNFKVTPRIQIVAPGPNGKAHWNELDPECFTIVVNKSCEIPEIRKDLWLVADPTAHLYKDTRAQWFNYGLEHCFDIACFDSGKLFQWYPDVPYTHEWGDYLRSSSYGPFPYVLRGGTTISGQAVQLAYWLEATEIVLCGVDLTTNKYFDDSSTYIQRREGNEPWEWVYPKFQMLVDWIIKHGVKVYSLSKTALKVNKV
jgi:hypothetical protein